MDLIARAKMCKTVLRDLEEVYGGHPPQTYILKLIVTYIINVFD